VKNFLCCFLQHGAFHFTAKYWMKIFKIKEWQSIEVLTAKLQEFFGPILLKNIKISNVHNFGNTGPILKIPTWLSSEAWHLSPHKISWILVRVKWKIPILLDHLIWNDPKTIKVLSIIATVRILIQLTAKMICGLKSLTLQTQNYQNATSLKV